MQPVFCCRSAVCWQYLKYVVACLYGNMYHKFLQYDSLNHVAKSFDVDEGENIEININNLCSFETKSN